MNGLFVRRIIGLVGVAMLIGGLTPVAISAAGPATQLAFETPPSTTAAGAVISPAVTVSIQDAANTIVTGSSGMVTIAIGNNPGGGTLSGTLTVAAINGLATFSDLSINAPGTGYTLTATSSGLASATSAAFLIGAANHLAFVTQPGGAAAGAIWSQQSQVAVEDVNNLVVTMDNSTLIGLSIGTNPAGGTLSCTSGTTLTVVNGIATFGGCAIDQGSVNPYTLVANSNPAFTPATSAAFLVGATVQLLPVTISTDTAVGQTIAGFSASTKVVTVGDDITVRVETSPALAGATVRILVAKKSGGTWGAFLPHASITLDSNGLGYYVYHAGSAVWESFLAVFPGNTTYIAATSHARQARWL